MKFTRKKLFLSIALLNLATVSGFVNAKVYLPTSLEEPTFRHKTGDQELSLDGDKVFSATSGFDIKGGNVTLKNTEIQAAKNAFYVFTDARQRADVTLDNITIKYNPQDFQNALNDAGIGLVAPDNSNSKGIFLSTNARASGGERVFADIKNTNVTVTGNALYATGTDLNVTNSSFTSLTDEKIAVIVEGNTTAVLKNVNINSRDTGLSIANKSFRGVPSTLVWDGGEININYKNNLAKNKNIFGVQVAAEAIADIKNLKININRDKSHSEENKTATYGVAIVTDPPSVTANGTLATLDNIDIKINGYAVGSIGLIDTESVVNANNINIEMKASDSIGAIARGKRAILTMNNSTIRMTQDVANQHFSTSAIRADKGSSIIFNSGFIIVDSVKGRAFDIIDESKVSISNTKVTAINTVGNIDPLVSINGGSFEAVKSSLATQGDNRVLFAAKAQGKDTESNKVNSIKLSEVVASVEGKNSKYLQTGYQSKTSFVVENSTFSGAERGFESSSDAENNIDFSGSNLAAINEMFYVRNAKYNVNLNNSKVISGDYLIKTVDKAGEINLVSNNSRLEGKVSKFTGSGSVLGKTNITMTDSEWVTDSGSNLDKLTLDNSNIKFKTAQPGNILEINQLSSTNSFIELNTVFGDDSSLTDKIIINGSAKGQTGLKFVNAGGAGASTKNGILVVDAINNATTDADAFYLHQGSTGYRAATGSKEASIAVGAYDYFLIRGADQSKNESNWYLSSVKNPDIIPPVDPDDEIEYRPEVGGYLANLQLATRLQRHKWQDRRGQTLNQDADSIAWIRVQADKSSFNDQFGSKRRTTSELIHFGTDVWRHAMSDGSRLDIGVMGLLGKGETKTHNSHTKAKSSLDSYNFGAYLTWQQTPNQHTGGYLDSWLMYGTVDNKVKGDGLASESYKTKAYSASLEGGYTVALNQHQTWYLQPQAQLIWSGYNAGHHTENSNTQVKWKSDNQLTTRLGTRLLADFETGSGVKMQPFVEANYWNYSNNSKMIFDKDKVKDKAPTNAVELSLGLQASTQNNIDIWTRLSVEKGNHQYRHINGQLGVTYHW
ncbi:autotransporter outer membrane beta-barrel domain-containing protein [Pseudomonas sp. F1_0610]|uniref:autotransporter family protein n=1 Tax=Pseudomonas sp. F1_0610 TaxID=3114284 RepID=UPI0039C4A746